LDEEENQEKAGGSRFLSAIGVFLNAHPTFFQVGVVLAWFTLAIALPISNTATDFKYIATLYVIQAYERNQVLPYFSCAVIFSIFGGIAFVYNLFRIFRFFWKAGSKRQEMLRQYAEYYFGLRRDPPDPAIEVNFRASIVHVLNLR